MHKNNNNIYFLWLSISDVSATKQIAIHKIYGELKSFWHDFSPSMEPVLGSTTFKNLSKNKNESFLQEQLNNLNKNEIQFITIENKEYPELLKNIYGAPYSLYLLGNEKLLQHKRSIGIVGTRRPSRYGEEIAYRIARDLSKEDIAIVSGFATGIDSAAHKGAIDGKGFTIAVLGNGLNIDYPKSNQYLRRKLLDSGGLFISEYPPDAKPIGYRFPQRNRIISGLANGLLFIEGRLKSGGMITVRHSLEQGREVFTIPIEIGKIGSEGPLTLLREGARLVTGARDIMEDLSWNESSQIQQLTIDDLAPIFNCEEQKIIYNFLLKEDYTMQELIDITHFPVDVLSSNLTFLEIEGIIKKSPGNIYSISRT